MARGCSEAGCERPHVARGFCHLHYRRFLHAGGDRVVNPTRHYGLADDERFWVYVQKGPRCWEWTGYKNAKGYGIINLRGERVMAHRMSYEMAGGSIPDGLYVLHHCDNPCCVKPKHLFIGTKAENNADMDAKGRARRVGAKKGEANPSARLTEADARIIRDSDEKGVILAARYGVTPTTITSIRKRRIWAHIDQE